VLCNAYYFSLLLEHIVTILQKKAIDYHFLVRYAPFRKMVNIMVYTMNVRYFHIASVVRTSEGLECTGRCKYRTI
jgi:hypothetical protein